MAPAAEVVVSELVTNAVRAQKRRRIPTPVGVRLLADPVWLAVEVWDCVQAAPQIQQPDIARELNSGGDSDGHGNGLVVVAAFSNQWGYFWRPDGGKVVFALFAL